MDRPPASLSFPLANGVGSSPPLGVMNTPINNPAPCSDSYDNAPLLDNCSPPLIDDGFAARKSTLSTGGGYGTPALPPSPPPMKPVPSHHRFKCAPRASSVDTGLRLEGYDLASRPRPGNVEVKFRLKGGYRQGITLREAREDVRVSRSIAYSLHDLNLCPQGRITLKVRWIGFRSLMYVVPVRPEIEGYADLQSLARRVARAIVHFMTFNAIAHSWDCVVLHGLEQATPHIWIPKITTH